LLAPAIEASPYSATVAAGGLAYLLLQRGEAARRERTAHRDRFVYAALAANRFMPRAGDDLLR